jgi:aspartate 4-decarboxylase
MATDRVRYAWAADDDLASLFMLADDRTAEASDSMLATGLAAPDWIATPPREAFFALGEFAAAEARHAGEPEPLGCAPAAEGVALRLDDWMARRGVSGGAGLLRRLVTFAVSRFSFDADAFVAELAHGALGSRWPPALLPHAEVVLNDHVMRTLCDDRPPEGRFHLAASNGATASVGGVLRALVATGHLSPGDRVAITEPVHPPWCALLEAAGLVPTPLARAAFDSHAAETRGAQTLSDRSIRALMLVDPDGRTGFEDGTAGRAALARLIRERRPDLIVIADGTYGGFAAAHQSLLALAPANVIAVQSLSKLYGCAGWRLGLIALHESNILDPAPSPANSAEGIGRAEPSRTGLIDRIAAESCDGVPSQTVGLSTPQQIMMTLFALWTRIGDDRPYREAIGKRLAGRERRLQRGLSHEAGAAAQGRRYYAAIDLEAWLAREWGAAFARHVRDRLLHVDILYRLAKRHGLVLRGGVLARGAPFSLVVCLASTPEDICDRVGDALRDVTEDMHAAWLGGAASPSEGPR